MLLKPNASGLLEIVKIDDQYAPLKQIKSSKRNIVGMYFEYLWRIILQDLSKNKCNPERRHIIHCKWL
jgi:hypothetical protein